METEYPALPTGDTPSMEELGGMVGDDRRGATGDNRRDMVASSPVSSHTTAPPTKTPIPTNSPPEQTDNQPPDLPAPIARDASPVLPCYSGESILEGHSFLGEIEILRMASPPPPKQRRRQSPSPDSQGRRLLTPTKDDSTTPKKVRTPRKDTPVKKRTRLQCRVKGCRDYLSSVRARDRHETEYCRFREGAGPGISSDITVYSSLD